MNKILSTLALVLVALGAQAQNAYPLFAPSNGIMVGNENTFVTTSATGADVTSLFSGTCNATSFLRGDASCFDLFAAANTWTAQNLFSNGSNAGALIATGTARGIYGWFEADAAANNGRWRASAENEQLSFELLNDAATASTSFLFINRTANTVDSVDFTATDLEWNNLDMVNVGSSPTWTGIHTFSNNSTFNSNVLISSAGPTFRLNETDAAANNRLWDVFVNTEQLQWRLVDDAVSSGVAYLTVNRTANVVDSLALSSTLLTWNGSDLVAENNSPTWTGTHTWTQNMNLSKADPRFCTYDSGSDATFFWRMSSDVLRLNIVDGSVCTTTGASSPFAITSAAGTVSALGITSTALTWNGLDMVNTGSAPTWTGQHVFSSSSGAINLNSVNPALQWNESDQGVDGKLWNLIASAGSLQFQTRTDAGGAGSVPLSMTRSGTTVTGIGLTATTTTVTGALSVTGATTSSGLLSASAGGEAFNLKPAASDHAYIGLYADTAAPTTRTGYVGYGSAGTTTLDIFNEANSPLRLATNNTARLTIDGDGSWSVGGGEGTSGQVLTSNGSGSAPTWQSVGAGDAILAANQTFTGQNTFTNATDPIQIEGTAPQFHMDETDAAANERNWLTRAVAGQWALSVATDAAPTTAVDSAIVVDRNGTTITSIALTATDVTVNTERVATAITARKTSPTTRTSTIVSAADPDLTFTLPAGSWELTGYMLFDGITTTTQGYRYQLNFAGTFDPALVVRCVDTRTSNLANAVVGVQGMNSDTLVADVSTANLDIAEIRCTMRATASGTLQIRWAQEASSANGTRLNNGSWLVAKRIGN